MSHYTTIEVSAAELKERDPGEFERQYWRWVEHAYWEPEFDYTLQRWQSEHGVHVEKSNISYSGFYSQGDGLAFDGLIEVQRVMDALELETKAPALYLDVKEFGTNWLTVKRGSGRGVYFSGWVDWDYSPGNCSPAGIFAGLDDEAWDELVLAQHNEWADVMCDTALELARRLADELYSELEADYEHCTSEESFVEHCEANDVTFEIEIEVEDEEPCI